MKEREYIVSKSNKIVQNSRYKLSVTEQRTIAYICSLIKPNTNNIDYEFNIKDYTKICNLVDSGRNYEETKAILKGLITKIIWITKEDGTETTVNWVQKVWTNKRNGKAKIRLDEDMIPYLFNLHEKFLSYGLYNILSLKSQFSIRLYELLKSYSFMKSKVFDLDELKKILMVDNIKSYNNFKDFRKRVIEKAQSEINELTDINVIYEPILKGKKVVQIKFKIIDKSIIEKFMLYKNAIE